MQCGWLMSFFLEEHHNFFLCNRSSCFIDKTTTPSVIKMEVAGKSTPTKIAMEVTCVKGFVTKYCPSP